MNSTALRLLLSHYFLPSVLSTLGFLSSIAVFPRTLFTSSPLRDTFFAFLFFLPLSFRRSTVLLFPVTFFLIVFAPLLLSLYSRHTLYFSSSLCPSSHCSLSLCAYLVLWASTSLFLFLFSRFLYYPYVSSFAVLRFNLSQFHAARSSVNLLYSWFSFSTLVFTKPQNFSVVVTYLLVCSTLLSTSPSASGRFLFCLSRLSFFFLCHP